MLLRPRFGDFCYDGYEFETLKEEVCLFREAGADGVVIGILKPDGRLDTDRMKELVECAKSESKSGKRHVRSLFTELLMCAGVRMKR